MKKLIILFTLSGLLFSYSCSNTNNSGGENEISVEESTKGTEKLNILVGNFNGFSSSAYKEYQDYSESFGNNPEKFETYKKWYNGGEFHDHTIKKVQEMEEASKIEIYSELNPYINAYQENALALSKAVKETYSYFDMKDYESDDFEKAKEHHSKTIIAYENFFVIDNLLRNKSDSIQSELEVKYLQKLKDDGETLRYLVGMSMNKSAKMLKVTQSEEYENLNVEELEKANQEVRAIFDEITKFKDENTDEFNADVDMHWFYSALTNFTKASKELTTRKKTNKPFSTGEKMNLNASSGWMVNGSTFKVLKKYNEMIDNYNRMMN